VRTESRWRGREYLLMWSRPCSGSVTLVQFTSKGAPAARLKLDWWEALGVLCCVRGNRAVGLTSRLSNAPDLYSWSDFYLSERSVLGIRQHALRVTRSEDGGQETLDERALCLDFGFEPGAES